MNFTRASIILASAWGSSSTLELQGPILFVDDGLEDSDCFMNLWHIAVFAKSSKL